MARNNTRAVREVCGISWKIEQFHRETKQPKGIEGCGYRKSHIVRNHTGCSCPGMSQKTAYETGKTVYQIKHDLLSDYLKYQLKSPCVKMTLV